MMIWISFFTNFLILVSALFVGLKNKFLIEEKSYVLFLLLTGLSSGLAAFGHLPLISPSWSSYLLLASRVLSIISAFMFARGSLNYANFMGARLLIKINFMLLIAALIWLLAYNLFLPVIVYGVICLVGIGVPSLLSMDSTHNAGKNLVLIGIIGMAISAIVFTIFQRNYEFISLNLSHIIVALSLISFALGFERLTLKLR